MAHSPGPWRWDSSGAPILEDANGTFILAVEMGRTDDADARLIAAAPELLVRFKRRVAVCKDCDPPVACPVCVEDMALLDRIEPDDDVIDT